MGGRVSGAGTDTIRIQGVSPLNCTDYTVIPDRIEAGTFMPCRHYRRPGNGGKRHSRYLTPLIAKLKEAGCEVAEEAAQIQSSCSPIRAIDVKTLPYPVSTDLQSPMMALLTLATGTSSLPKLYSKTVLCMNNCAAWVPTSR